MEHLEQLVKTYGYWALFFGTFLEGETILIIAGIAAAQGLLELRWTIVSAFLGSMAGDQLHFFIARCNAEWILARFPSRRRRLEEVLKVVEHHSIWLVLVFRFLYGLRNLTAFAIGMTRMPIWLFAPLNAVGAAVWALCFALGGYFFGRALLPHLHQGRYLLIGALCLVALGLWLYRVWRNRKKARLNSAVAAVAPEQPPKRSAGCGAE